MSKIKELRNKQTEFQRLAGFPIDSISAKDRNEMSEKYLFKAIEEIIELRKEFPSVMNPWSKVQKSEDLTLIKEELADVILFIMNFANVWKFSEEEIYETIQYVQDRNFTHIKNKKMEILNSEIMKVPEEVISPGTGSLNPRFVFVGQNPGQSLKQGEIAWGEPLSGSSEILRSILKELGVDDTSYFTNLVKSPTEENSDPHDSVVYFWSEFLDKELEILRINNPDLKIITLGKWTGDMLPDYDNITHPAAILRGVKTKDEYREEIKKIVS